MRNLVVMCFAALILLYACNDNTHKHEEVKSISEEVTPDYAIVIHGGAGTIQRENMSAEKDSS